MDPTSFRFSCFSLDEHLARSRAKLRSTSGKRREEVRSWPAYVATLLRRFDPEMTAQMEKKPKEKAAIRACGFDACLDVSIL